MLKISQPVKTENNQYFDVLQSEFQENENQSRDVSGLRTSHIYTNSYRYPFIVDSSQSEDGTQYPILTRFTLKNKL